jgi:GTP-dependent phosphoenolpyruvate carboxykinase
MAMLPSSVITPVTTSATGSTPANTPTPSSYRRSFTATGSAAAPTVSVARVLKWAIERIEGTAAATETPHRLRPHPDALDLSGLDTDPADIAAALDVNPAERAAEIPLIEDWFATIGDKLPTVLHDELEALKHRLA